MNEIENIEAKLRQAMLDSDVAVLDELIADNLIFTAPTGEVVGKQADLAAHRTGSIEFTQIDVIDRQIQPYGDCVVVAVKTELTGRQNGQAFSGTFCYTRIWVKLQDRWQIGGGHVSQVLTPPESRSEADRV